ncbi:MAG: class I adenylate-forming enzyme family protein [Polyangiaceae bacterium]
MGDIGARHRVRGARLSREPATLSLGRVAGEQASRIALIDSDQPVSYGELWAGAQAAQGWLAAQGLLDAPLLASVAEASRRHIELVLAAIDLGLPIAFVHPRLHPAERHELLNGFPRTAMAPVLDASTLPAGGWPKQGSAPLPQTSRAPRDEAWRRWEAVLFTSGSTGAPKGVLLGAEQFMAAADASQQNLGWLADDRWLLSLPVAHVGGLSIVLRCLAARRTVVLPEPGAGLDLGRLTRAVERQQVSLMSLVPTQLERLDGWAPPRSLRAALIGGAAARPETIARARARGIPTLTTYGATEACSQLATQPLGSALREDGAVGPAVAGTRLEIREGRIAALGPQLMRGYLPRGNDNIDGAGLHAGWLVTSDAGELTEDGWLRVLGRIDDVIITGGENVHPTEVEAGLLKCSAVTHALVAGIPDPTFGQIVAALLVGDAAREADFTAYCLTLAPHKRPRRWRWVERLPELPNGKPDRRRVAELLS